MMMNVFKYGFLGFVAGIMLAAFMSGVFYVGYSIENQVIIDVGYYWKAFGILLPCFGMAGLFGGIHHGVTKT